MKQTLEPTGRPETSVTNYQYTLRNVQYQKTEGFIYIVAEAWNDETFFFSVKSFRSLPAHPQTFLWPWTLHALERGICKPLRKATWNFGNRHSTV